MELMEMPLINLQLSICEHTNRRQVVVVFQEACGGTTTIRMVGGPLNEEGEQGLLEQVFDCPGLHQRLIDVVQEQLKMNAPIIN
jgi:hypothetical protein